MSVRTKVHPSPYSTYTHISAWYRETHLALPADQSRVYTALTRRKGSPFRRGKARQTNLQEG